MTVQAGALRAQVAAPADGAAIQALVAARKYPEAETILRASMKRDADFHRIRLIPHTIALVAAGAIAFVPGPNVLGYLFTFTVVGHFLSWRGAVHALHGVAWTVVPNDELNRLHRAFSGGDADRHRVVLEVAERLHMPKMALFVERMAAPSA